MPVIEAGRIRRPRARRAVSRPSGDVTSSTARRRPAAAVVRDGRDPGAEPSHPDPRAGTTHNTARASSATQPDQDLHRIGVRRGRADDLRRARVAGSGAAATPPQQDTSGFRDTNLFAPVRVFLRDRPTAGFVHGNGNGQHLVSGLGGGWRPWPALNVTSSDSTRPAGQGQRGLTAAKILSPRTATDSPVTAPTCGQLRSPRPYALNTSSNR